MRVLLVHSVEKMILLAYHGLEVLTRNVFALAIPQHSYHCSQGSHDAAFRLVCTVEIASISFPSNNTNLKSHLFTFFSYLLSSKNSVSVLVLLRHWMIEFM